MADTPPESGSRATTRVNRRGVLAGSAALGVGAALLGAGAASAAARPRDGTAPEQAVPDALGHSQVDPYGAHQAGIATPLQAHASVVGLSLLPTTDVDALRRLMMLLTDDIERLTQGRPALADPVPELAPLPANLTVTVGFGPGVFDLPGLAAARPSWLAPLPVFKGDQLDPAYTGADLVLQICSDDPVTVSHTQRVLLVDSAAFASVAWVQRGFHRAAGTTAPGTVGRNLLGQVDGIVNPVPGTADFDRVVWSDAPEWLVGGTGMVVRRARMELDTWTALDRAGREDVIGRTLSDGAPLTGGGPTDPVDLKATDERGLSVIAPTAHVRLAAPTNPDERIFRRPYNYDDGREGQAGLIFIAFAADIVRQYLSIQQRLAESDLLNTWVVHVGSAVAAVPPGFAPGGYIGETLLDG